MTSYKNVWSYLHFEYKKQVPLTNKGDVERDRDKTFNPFAELFNTGNSLLWLLQYISKASFPDHTDNNK